MQLSDSGKRLSRAGLAAVIALSIPAAWLTACGSEPVGSGAASASRGDGGEDGDTGPIARLPSTLASDKATYTRSETVTLAFANLSGDPHAAIVIATAGSAPGESIARLPVNATSGAVTYALGTVPLGTYVARAYRDETEVVDVESAPFAVTNASQTTLTLDKAAYTNAESATIRFTQMSGSPRDWIALAPRGSKPRAFTKGDYTRGAFDGSVVIDLHGVSAGEYVVRAFFDNGAVVQAQTASFRITDVAPPIVDAGADADAWVEPPAPSPPVCGDGWRDPATEECDDQNAVGTDSCSAVCRVRAISAVATATVDAGAISRSLGGGAHPVAAGAESFGLAITEPGTAFPRLAFARLNRFGAPLGAQIPIGEGSNPVVAPLPQGRFAIAYNDIGAGGDGDELGVALRIADASSVVRGGAGHANATIAFDQFDPDIVFTGSEIVVAWTDTSNALSGRDIRARRFSATLDAISQEETIAASAAAESDVVLAAIGGSWAAAWRTSEAGSESIDARSGGVAWTVGPFLPGPAGSKPALVALDDTHLLLVYSEGVDAGDGTFTSRPRGAVLDKAAPGPAVAFDVAGLTASWVSAVRSGDRTYIAWQSDAVLGDPLSEELWMREVTWNGTARLSASIPSLARWPQHRSGDQRTPALAAFGRGTQTSVLAAWVDLGGAIGPGTKGDIAVQLMPTPILRLAGGSP
jgi:cysteine-rich repeat protein